MNERIKRIAAQCWDLQLDGKLHFDQEKFADFMSWVTNYNEYIINTYAEKASSKNDLDLDEVDIDGVVDVEFEEEVA